MNEFGPPIVSGRLLRIDRSRWDKPEGVFVRIQGAALNSLLACISGANPDLELRILLLLDYMLRVLGEPTLTSTIAFATPNFRKIQKIFYSALGSKRFVNAAFATRISWARGFGALMKNLAKLTPVEPINHRKALSENLAGDFDKLPLDMAEVLMLRPFMLTSKSGVEYKVLLGPLTPVLGADFTTSFHECLKDIARSKAKDSALRDFGTTFARFIQHHDAENALNGKLLLDPGYIQTLIVDFMEFHFMKMTRRAAPVQEGTLSSLQKLWGRYRVIWRQLAAKGVLAMPAAAFPEGNPKLIKNDSIGHRRVVTNDDGTSTVITQKLIVSVPLHLTDEEATQLLFQKLKVDFSKLQDWLKLHLEELFGNYKRGKTIADDMELLPPEPKLRKLFLETRADDTGVVLAVKYFMAAHDGYIDTSKHSTLPYPNLTASASSGPPKMPISRLLGLPLRRDALALMAFLASQDGRFSEAAMAGCILLDRNGKRINAVETDGGLILSVVKERDANDGWHNITLKESTADYVRLWIAMTGPLRAYMRKNGVEGWRNLFIYVSRPLGAPAHFTRSTNLYNSFKTFASSGRSSLGELADHLTIARIRSTRGILVFLETMDLASMARELGNSSDCSLKHYLPDALWDYFATRWIRIFQNLLIVEATKGSPHMQRALKFQSAEEMDEFLRNHAVESLLPANAPDVISPTRATLSEVMVPASLGLFTTLLSITAAADSAALRGCKLAPQALYWSEFTKRVKAHIESDEFHDRGVKMLMVEAATKACSTNFDEVVCA